MFFNRVDQLWNIDRLRDDRMSFNANSAFCFDCGDQPCLKDYWRVVQVTIGVNLFRSRVSSSSLSMPSPLELFVMMTMPIPDLSKHTA